MARVQVWFHPWPSTSPSSSGVEPHPNPNPNPNLATLRWHLSVLVALYALSRDGAAVRHTLVPWVGLRVGVGVRFGVGVRVG
eukprot:scaffold121579_cov21-Phaeocystis_antarctica.AAC.1